MDYFLTSPRIGFRRWAADDLDLALGLWGDKAVTQFIDARGELSLQQVAQRLHDEIALQEDSGIQYWPIFLRLTGEHLGCCGLRPYDPAKGVLELGFHLRRAYWGQGYASEAARAAMEYAFCTLGAKVLFAGHNPLNKVSRTLLNKLGFTYTHDEYYQPTGCNHPSYLLTAEEFQCINTSIG